MNALICILALLLIIILLLLLAILKLQFKIEDKVDAYSNYAKLTYDTTSKLDNFNRLKLNNINGVINSLMTHIDFIKKQQANISLKLHTLLKLNNQSYNKRKAKKELKTAQISQNTNK